MVRHKVRVQVRYGVTTEETSQIDRTKIHSNYIGNKPERPVTVKTHQPSRLVVTIVQYRQRYNSKRQENNEVQQKHYDQNDQS